MGTVAICAILFIAISAIAGRFLFVPFGKYHHETTSSLAAMESALDRGGKGIAGVPEYAPLGARNNLVAIGLPDACLVSDPSTVLRRPKILREISSLAARAAQLRSRFFRDSKSRQSRASSHRSHDP
jgi:hypothetical protein